MLPAQVRTLLNSALTLVLLLLLGGCAQLPANLQQNTTYALSQTENTALGQTIRPGVSAHPGLSGFQPLQNGVDALLARIVLAEAAERSLDVQYYIWHDDLTGRHFAHALLDAADRGVRVRILIDDWGVSPKDADLLLLDAHPNIEIRLFNPIAWRSLRGLGLLLDFKRSNRRMHNKAFVADNQIAIVGGRNIGDEYFDASGSVAFGDLDVLTIGPVVADVSQAFDHFWNAPVSYPITTLSTPPTEPGALDRIRQGLDRFIAGQRETPYIKHARNYLIDKLTTEHEALSWGKAHLLYDDPAKITRSPEITDGHLLPQLGHLNSNVQQELLIVSPYFIPGQEGVDWLSGLVRRGVRVTVLTNSLASTDVPAVHSAYQPYREAMLAGGVQLYEMKPAAIKERRTKASPTRMRASSASLHAKTFIYDRQAVFIGSLNLDPRSVNINTEIGIVCESPVLAEEIAGELDQIIDRIAWRLERRTDAAGQANIVWIEEGEDGRQEHHSEPDASLWRRASVWFLRMLPIDSQL